MGPREPYRVTGPESGKEQEDYFPVSTNGTERAKLKVAYSWEWNLAMTPGDQWTDGNKDNLEDSNVHRLLRPKSLSCALVVYNLPVIRLNSEGKARMEKKLNELISPTQ